MLGQLRVRKAAQTTSLNEMAQGVTVKEESSKNWALGQTEASEACLSFLCTESPAPALAASPSHSPTSVLEMVLGWARCVWCFRTSWPLRKWQWTSPRRSGHCWALLRKSCTEMWWWRTWGTWPPWVRLAWFLHFFTQYVVYHIVCSRISERNNNMWWTQNGWPLSLWGSLMSSHEKVLISFSLSLQDLGNLHCISIWSWPWISRVSHVRHGMWVVVLGPCERSLIWSVCCS